ncbi:unnamed protein product [Soboliphyme baturini]|uniref:CYTOSOL_AP domain-containing protein n=1 Tax=Soboliphyme baturini TaxID=241478 RepID=A0A183J7U8_9BILA|nr:unnamed protein product [Soboliphyme baturini]
MGLRKVLLFCLPHRLYPTSELVTLLGAMQSLYVVKFRSRNTSSTGFPFQPIEIRETAKDMGKRCDVLGVWSCNGAAATKEMVDFATAVEAGRAVARDIAGSDPERMSPPNICDYLQSIFADSSSVRMKIVSDQNIIKEQYPLLAAVNRAANGIPRHEARVVKLQFTGAGEPQNTLMLVGKGVTLDAGGLDIKTNGNMWGMSRDKSGAAAVAGFFKVGDFFYSLSYCLL